MDVKILATVFGVLVTTVICQSIPEPPATENTGFVPGVFITADALKSLQEKAKNPDGNTDESQTEPPKVSKKSDQVSDINPSDQFNQGYQQNQPIPEQLQMNQPMDNQQNIPPNQPVYSNQPMLNQPPYSNQQPILLNQQAPQPNLLNQQPNLLNQQPGYNQQFGYQQPGYQQPGYQQPGYQQPGYQQPGYQTGMGPPYLPNQQAIALQPGYQNQQGMLVNQQPLYQQPILTAQQPNQQLFIPNGQINQPNIANPNLAGQPMLMGGTPVNGAMITSPGQGQSNLYAMVPINSQNTIPNPNLGNNNAYFVPVQQMPSNAVLLNNGK